MRTSQEVCHTLIRSMAEMECIRQLLLVAMYDVNLKVVILRFQILALLTLNRVNPNNESLLTQIGFHDLTLNANTGLVINDFQNLNVGNSGGTQLILGLIMRLWFLMGIWQQVFFQDLKIALYF